MSETNNSGEKTLGAPAPKATLHLKRPVEQGTVRQSFSHGRSKTVVVEKVKRRAGAPGEAREPAPAQEPAAKRVVAPGARRPPQPAAPARGAATAAPAGPQPVARAATPSGQKASLVLHT